MSENFIGIRFTNPRRIQDNPILTFEEVNALREEAATSVKFYGAKGDGIKDDTQAIRDAVDVAVSAGGGIIFIPKGIYLVSNYIHIASDNIIIQGEGRGITVIRRSSNWNDPIFQNNLFVFAKGNIFADDNGVLGPTNIFSCGIQNMTIESTVEMNVPGAHIHMLNTSRCFAKQLHLKNGFYGFHGRGFGNSILENIHVDGESTIMTTTQTQQTQGIRFSFSYGTARNTTAFLSDIFVLGNNVLPPPADSGYYHCMNIECCDGLWINHMYLGGAADNGHNLRISNRPSPTTSVGSQLACKIIGLMCTNFWSDYTTGVVIDNDNLQNVVCRNIQLTNFSAYGLNGAGNSAIIVITDLARDVSIVNARIHDYGLSGIDIQKGYNIRVIGSAVRNCNLSNTPFVSCINVNFSGSAITPPDGVIIQGCSLGFREDLTTALTVYGIIIGANALNINACHNDLRGNATGGLANNAAPTGTTITKFNTGYVSENVGTGNISSGATSQVITHGLARTPLASNITITQMNSPTNLVSAIWITTITATQFTVNINTDPGASGFLYRWAAEIKPWQ